MAHPSISVNRCLGLIFTSALAVLWVVGAPTACHAATSSFGGSTIPTLLGRLRPYASGFSIVASFKSTSSSSCTTRLEIAYKNLKTGGKDPLLAIYKGNSCSAKPSAATAAVSPYKPEWKNATKERRVPWAKGRFSQEFADDSIAPFACSSVVSLNPIFSNPTAYRAVLSIGSTGQVLECVPFKKL